MSAPARIGPAAIVAALALSVLSCGAQVETQDAAEATPTTATVGADPRFESIRQEILQEVESGSIPSIAIAVAMDGEILWEEAIGWADPQQNIRATPDTSYAVASVAKTVTSAGAFKAIELGAFRLESNAAEFLKPGILKSKWYDTDSITIRDLMTMSAGLPQGFKVYIPPESAQSTAEALRSHGGLVGFPPGEFFYSNNSHSVIELAIEGATGRSFDAFMKAEIFDPLGMQSTYYDVYGHPDGVETAIGHLADGQRLPENASSPAGGGGLRSSAHDLIRFAAFIADAPVGSSVLSQRSIRKMREKSYDFARPLADYGNGIWIRDLDPLSYYIADGHGFGVAAEMLAFPDQGLAVVTLMNTRKDAADYPGQLNSKYGAKISDAILPGFYDAVVAEKNASRTLDRREPIPPEFLGVWHGAVRDHEGDETAITMTFQADGDIHVELEDQYVVLLNGARYVDELLLGEFPGMLSIDLKPEFDHAIVLYLKYDGGRLTGFLEANYADSTGEFGVPNLVWLERDQSQ